MVCLFLADEDLLLFPLDNVRFALPRRQETIMGQTLARDARVFSNEVYRFSELFAVFSGTNVMCRPRPEIDAKLADFENAWRQEWR